MALIWNMRQGELIILFLSQSDKNSGCYGNLQLPLTYNWKNENWHLLLYQCRYFDKTFTEMFLEWSSTKHNFCPNLSFLLVVMATERLNLPK